MKILLLRALVVSIALSFAALEDSAAQTASKVPRVGVLHAGSSNEASTVQREPFERGLREHGWIPGGTVSIDYRYADGDATKLPRLAAELVSAGAVVIVARGNPAIRAARMASPTIPVVMSAGEDPVEAGFVNNLSRPGGNTTGITNLAFDLDGKRLEVLKEAFPGISRVAVLANPDFDGTRYDQRMASIHAAAKALKLQIRVIEVRHAREVGNALAMVEASQPDALLVRGDPQVLDPSRSQIVAMAAKQRLPSIYAWRFFVDVGGLMSYGTSLSNTHHRSATYVSRILRGASAGELAVEQPTKFELIVNLKAAKSTGFEISKPVLFRADELIR
jgi:putative tryptophan/tyrosine transport system substrate-binding protein